MSDDRRPPARPARGMQAGTTIIVFSGVALAVGVGLARGIDTTAAIVLFFVVAFGVLALRAAHAAGRGRVAPAHCVDCGGLISPNAPYCKHCGTPTQQA